MTAHPASLRRYSSRKAPQRVGGGDIGDISDMFDPYARRFKNHYSWGKHPPYRPHLTCCIHWVDVVSVWKFAGAPYLRNSESRGWGVPTRRRDFSGPPHCRKAVPTAIVLSRCSS